MPRIGFKKTYAPGDFDNTAVLAVFNRMKTLMVQTGFILRLETDESFDVIQAGAAFGIAHDDVPHWAFRYEAQGIASVITAYTVFGERLGDPAAITHGSTIVHSGFVGIPSPELTLWFAADGIAGWWWIHGLQVDASSENGVTHQIASAGTTSRRYPADNYQGLCARYGIWDPGGNWSPAYARYPNGSLNVFPATATWSPFGEGWAFNGRRHPGSPLPKMAVPHFPNRNNGVTACILGEFNEILILTDGYVSEEIVIPGWIAMIGNDNAQPYAVPAPDTFTIL